MTLVGGHLLGARTSPLRGHSFQSAARNLVRHTYVTAMSVLVRHVGISHLAPDVDSEIVTVRGERKRGGAAPQACPHTV